MLPHFTCASDGAAQPRHTDSILRRLHLQVNASQADGAEDAEACEDLEDFEDFEVNVEELLAPFAEEDMAEAQQLTFLTCSNLALCEDFSLTSCDYVALLGGEDLAPPAPAVPDVGTAVPEENLVDAMQWLQDQGLV